MLSLLLKDEAPLRVREHFESESVRGGDESSGLERSRRTQTHSGTRRKARDSKLKFVFWKTRRLQWKVEERERSCGKITGSEPPKKSEIPEPKGAEGLTPERNEESKRELK